MQSRDSRNSSLPSSSSLPPEELQEVLRDLSNSRGFPLFLGLVRDRLLEPAESRLRQSREVPDLFRAQGSVESLDQVLNLLHNTLRSSQGGKS